MEALRTVEMLGDNGFEFEVNREHFTSNDLASPENYNSALKRLRLAALGCSSKDYAMHITKLNGNTPETPVMLRFVRKTGQLHLIAGGFVATEAFVVDGGRRLIPVSQINGSDMFRRLYNFFFEGFSAVWFGMVNVI